MISSLFWAFVYHRGCRSRRRPPGISGSTVMLAAWLSDAACAIAAQGRLLEKILYRAARPPMGNLGTLRSSSRARITRIVIELLSSPWPSADHLICRSRHRVERRHQLRRGAALGPRSSWPECPTSTVIIMIAVQIVLSMSWIVQGCAAMTARRGKAANHLGFGAPIIGFVLLYIVDLAFHTVGILHFVRHDRRRPPTGCSRTSPVPERRWEPTVSPTSSGACHLVPVRPDPGAVGVPLRLTSLR